MSKKIISIFILSLFFSLFNLAYADVVINEVQLKPAGESFIELYNSGSSLVDLTSFYIKKKTSTGTESNFVVSSRFEGKSISSGGYLLLAQENKYTGAGSPDIFWPSSYNLASNNSLTLYRGNDTDKNEVSWETVEEGKSIQKDGGSWTVGAPTPREINEAGGDDSSNNNENNEEEDTMEQEIKVVLAPTMKAKIIASSVAFAGQPFVIETDVFGYAGESVVLGRANWNFGDGTSLEQINNFEKFSHTYFYPGEYIVFLEYYSKKTSKVPEVTSKMIIKVLPTTVVISKVGDAKDFFVELSNNATSDIDISNWVLNANGKIFIFPKNSVIMSKKSMTISGRITGFVYGDQSNLKLLSSTGEFVFEYPAFSSRISTKVSTSAKAIIISPPPQEEDEITSDLQASAIESDVVEDNPMRTYFLTTIMTVFLGGSASAVYFIRRKKVPFNEGDDFKILDE